MILPTCYYPAFSGPDLYPKAVYFTPISGVEFYHHKSAPIGNWITKPVAQIYEQNHPFKSDVLDRCGHIREKSIWSDNFSIPKDLLRGQVFDLPSSDPQAGVHMNALSEPKIVYQDVYCMINTGKYLEVIQALISTHTLNFSLNIENCNRIMADFIECNQLNFALAIYYKVMPQKFIEPDSTCYQMLIKECFKDQNLKKVYELFSNIIPSDTPEYRVIQSMVVKGFLKIGDIEGALYAYNTSYSSEALLSDEMFAELMTHLVQAQKLTEALQVLTKTASATLEQYQLLIMHLSLDQKIDKAVECFNLALKMHPRSIVPLCSAMFDELFKNQMNDVALECCERVLHTLQSKNAIKIIGIVIANLCREDRLEMAIQIFDLGIIRGIKYKYGICLFFMTALLRKNDIHRARILHRKMMNEGIYLGNQYYKEVINDIYYFTGSERLMFEFYEEAIEKGYYLSKYTYRILISSLFSKRNKYYVNRMLLTLKNQNPHLHIENYRDIYMQMCKSGSRNNSFRCLKKMCEDLSKPMK